MLKLRMSDHIGFSTSFTLGLYKPQCSFNAPRWKSLKAHGWNSTVGGELSRTLPYSVCFGAEMKDYAASCRSRLFKEALRFVKLLVVCTQTAASVTDRSKYMRVTLVKCTLG